MRIEVEREDDGRWIAEVVGLPGVLAYGADRADAVARVEALALEELGRPDGSTARGDSYRAGTSAS